MPVRDSSFDDLLYEVSRAPDSEVEAILQRCPEPALRDAVRRLLAREEALGDFLQPPNPKTVLPPPSGGGGGGGEDRGIESWLGTSAAGLSTSRRLLRRVGRGLGFVFVGLGCWFALAHSFPFRPWTTDRTAELAALCGLAVASLALVVAARSPRLGNAAAVGAGYLYFVLCCGFMGSLHATHELHTYGQVTPFGPFIVFIGLFPLVLQASLRATLSAAVAGALAALVGLAVGARAYSPTMDLPLGADMIGGLLGSIALAVVIHRSVKVLRREIASGLRLGSYQLEGKLGEGGMGEVWRATHPLLARPAAVKLVRAVHLDALQGRREVVLERFHREARAIASLESSHTVRLFDFGVAEDGNVFLAMELLDGIDLLTFVRRFGAQPVDRVRSILLQICDSLAEAHDKGLVHRDIKPANVMLCRQGHEVDQVKVLDFGSVGLTERSEAAPAELTDTGALLGTPAYLAPELLSGDGVASAQGDLYGVGCIAYWLLVGRPVFEHASAMMQIAAHLRDPPKPPSSLGVALPAELEAAVLACLAKQPDHRPASAAHLASQLEAVPATGDWSMEKARAWWRENLLRA